MRRIRFAILFVVLLSCGTAATFAQSKNTENTLRLDEGTKQPPATVEDIEWLAGFWKGEAFGGQVEEMWSPGSVGTMVGTFKLMHDGAPTMYEIELIVEEAGSLVFKVKHFNADFSAWEDKEEFIGFPLVKLEENAAYFDGLTIRRISKDEVQLFLAVKTRDGVREEAVNYTRAE